MITLKNKLIGVVAVAVVSVALVACGGNANQQSAEKSGAEKTPAVENNAAAGASQALTGNIDTGKELYAQSCAACHGQLGEGVPGLGKNLISSEFAKSLTDAKLLSFIKVGRAADDPANTIGIAMPPKGGNPALTDQQLMDIVSYIRTLEK